MKRILSLILLLSLTIVHAQNLVPNPSFEEYDNCPIGAGSLPDAWEPTTYCTGWHKPGAGSSDYFNACAVFAGGPGVPNNFFGHQEARTGNAYVGGYFDAELPYLVREYVHRELSSTLIAGRTYYVRFWVSLSVAHTEFSSIYGINQIGAYFTENYLDEEFTYVIEGPAQVQPSPEEAYTDTVAWQPISGTFTAEGNENWITLGRFMSPGGLIMDTVVLTTGSTGGVAYYFVDDVCVIDLSGEPDDIKIHELAICDTVASTISGRPEVDNYIWDDGSTTPSRVITGYGTYWVKSVDHNDCKLVIDTFYLHPGAPVADFILQGDSVWCDGTTITLTPEPLPDGDFVWYDNTSADSKLATESGVFWLAVKNGCFSKSDTILISSFTPGSIQNDDSLFCLGSEIELIAAGDDENNYLWYPDLGVVQPYSKNTVLRIIEEGTYYLTSSRGNCSAIDSLQISIVEPPLVVLPEDTMLCKTEGVAITHQNLLNNVAYLWSTGDTSCCINIKESGLYRLTVIDECGQEASDEINVTIANCDYCILAPTAFSPNNDGLNDLFEVNVSCPMKNYRLSIFNRWGQMVFSTVNPDRHWDGLINGKPAGLGVYFYYIEATPAIDGLEKIVKKGDVTLVR